MPRKVLGEIGVQTLGLLIPVVLFLWLFGIIQFHYVFVITGVSISVLLILISLLRSKNTP